ncbi:MAG: hypothetical protein ACREH6_14760 [Geminicoccaceae bacterium]
MSDLILDVAVTTPPPSSPKALLQAEPGLYVNHENPNVYHLVTHVSAVNTSAKRMIVTFAHDPSSPTIASIVASQLNYFGRPAAAGAEVKLKVQGSTT